MAGPVDKLDVLFMIDNSISMSDKQAILRLAVPDLVNRLVNPICVDSMGNQFPAPAPGGAPPAGAAGVLRRGGGGPRARARVGIAEPNLLGGVGGGGGERGIAAGEPGEDAALYDTVHAVAMELCPALGISVPVGKDSLSMRTTWTGESQRFCT